MSRSVSSADRQTLGSGGATDFLSANAAACFQVRARSVSTFFGFSVLDWRDNCIASSAFSRNCSAFVMERSHPKSAPLTKGLLLLSGCLFKIAHCADQLCSLRREKCIGERCLAASGRLRFVLRELAADVGALTPSKGLLRDASHC